MHNGIRMTTLVKRALFICVGVLFLYEAMYGPTHIAWASTEDETKSVQLVSEIQTALAPKEAPKQYNGQVRKVAYLTFDDGPGKYTAELLEMLKKEDAKATFFLIGANVKAFPDLVKQELAEGHYVGMHSMTHNYKKLYTEGHYVDEMKEDQSLIAGIIGKSPILTRPPYGSMPGLNEALRNKVAEGGFKVWDWTIDSLDWKYNKVPVDSASAQIVQNVLAGATNPIEVVLMHDIHPQSVKAVPGIIKGLKEKGYELESYQEDEHFPLNFWHDKRM
ncbi:peptidoglycan-N-acetylglucosamine deacetylase [Bacillus pseudomycoides]|uniref:Peptidoglycan-N-acetylglucosamine deacetylase n=2 Tax=Bacillus pseudomycoides TaxID=64104 RepID=A0A2B6KF85_9BACI|nr:polysaccharide deacetylase family protein [Bacillus pseudomycoides]PDY44472.1 peptidoglycan-N-acetylglucosamine deacetylase [Bacillus pseudomycoides]PEA82628.1 peptidoglycan-N-acetylglucosamine deacetylase [Bacillus pseudomycoides]PED06013.1 peptidoglycan-N-acetylglucosamine deacetylase [Bacillus pseudomycoides]PED72350.1 peptidoglycan-N-acetylglucosamine deacetylase [Bacillus pseudomycoides]PEI39515.1 peptidoglycan-N-acetylglucosamine deacetylase [Bacillus pseudomycoides]